jgi:hypothetical protein
MISKVLGSPWTKREVVYFPGSCARPGRASMILSLTPPMLQLLQQLSPMPCHSTTGSCRGLLCPASAK